MIQTNGTSNGASGKPSMNEANEKDPFNNNCYGTLVDTGYKLVSLPVLDVVDFNERIIRGYEEGYGEKDLPADLSLARSLVPAGTATLRDFSNIAPEIPDYIPENCTGCMDCVTECPDTAILGKVLVRGPSWKRSCKAIPDEADRAMYREQWSKTKKYYDAGKKKGMPGGMFQIIIDPSKCKGCAECVTVCDDDALKMIDKTDEVMADARKSHRYFKNFGPSNNKYINDNLLIDMMLKEQTHIYVGGAGSCAGCGEGTALRMMCAATGSKYGDQWGIVAATGCNTVYTSTYPYNPYLVPWTNSLFENAPADAIGVRHALGPDGLAGQADLVHRRRRRHVRHRLPGAVAAARQRHEHQGVRARHAGLLQHRRPGVHGELHRPEHQDVGPRQDGRRQAGTPQGNRPDRHDAPAHLRGPDDLRPHQPLLQGGAGRAGVRRPGARRAATRPASRSTASPTTWPASRPGWPSIAGPSRS